MKTTDGFDIKKDRIFYIVDDYSCKIVKVKCIYLGKDVFGTVKCSFDNFPHISYTNNYHLKNKVFKKQNAAKARLIRVIKNQIKRYTCSLASLENNNLSKEEK